MIIQGPLFPKDRNIEANVALFRYRYQNENFSDLPASSQQIPQLVPDDIDSHMFQCYGYLSGNSCNSGIIKEIILAINHFGKVDLNVFRYEPIGTKRVRIDRDDSEEEYQKVKLTMDVNEHE